MPTVGQIIQAAANWSAMTDLNVLATTTELVGVVDAAQKRVMAIGGAKAPTLFARRYSISPPGAGNPWTKPETAGTVIYMQKTSGQRVSVVPVDDPYADGPPSVFFSNGGFYTVYGDPNPQTDTLVLTASAIPQTLAGESSQLDSLYPSAFTSLLELEVALYLAIKDQRANEAAALQALLDRATQSYMVWLENAGVATDARW